MQRGGRRQTTRCGLLDTYQRAFQANQKPCSKIPKTWGLLKQNSYTAFTTPFSFRPNLKEEKWSGYARLYNHRVVNAAKTLSVVVNFGGGS